MKNLLRNRWALSTVVTTLIILVVSVLLASVVTYFAINVTSTRIQEESLSLTSQHIWVASDATVQGAIMITDVGGRDVVISKITIRGQTIPWGNVFYSVAGADDSITNDLTYVSSLAEGSDLGFNATATAAGTNLVLSSGGTMIVFISSPDSITINDIGLTVGFAVFTSQAMYYKETNVNAYNL